MNCSREERKIKRDMVLEKNASLRTDVICTASVRSAISIPKARVAYQAIMEKAFGHRYDLSAEEQKKFEPSLQPINEDHEEHLETPESKQIRSKEDYESYKYVLPSERVLGVFKHDKSLHQEIVAGEALGNLEVVSKVTLHYDEGLIE